MRLGGGKFAEVCIEFGDGGLSIEDWISSGERRRGERNGGMEMADAK